MSFKDEVARDIHAVFLNDKEFADRHTLRYSGKTYENIPVTLVKQQEREKNAGNTESLYSVDATAYISETDLEGAILEPRQYLEIDDGTALGKPFFVHYRILSVDNAMGIYVVELEALDE